jgi:hypothetical protein
LNAGKFLLSAKKGCTEISAEKVDISLQSTYRPEKIDKIFQRIEGFSDSPSEKYNKEGALYHFYGAMFAASQWGTIAVDLVAGDNQALRHRQRTDRIKEAAGLAGAKLGLSAYSKSPGFVFENFLRLGNIFYHEE